MDILFVHSNPETCHVFSFAIEGSFSASVTCANDAHEAFDYLVEDHKIDLIICENSAANLKLFKFLLSVDSPLSCILIKSPTPNTLAFPDLKILGEVSADHIVDQIRPMLDAFRETLAQSPGEASDYVRIKTELLLKVAPLQADIFIQLSRIKFVRLFLKGDVFDEADLKRILKDKQVEYLYVKIDNAADFIAHFGETLTKLLADKGLKESSIPTLATSIHEACMEIGSQLGFTPEVQKLVKQNVQTVIQGATVAPSLKTLLARMSTDKKNYIPAHSVMVAHIACSIAIKMGWESDATYEKLTYAGFLHDVMLKNPDIAIIDTPDELKLIKNKFTPEEVRTFLSHVQESTNYVSQFSELPPDIETIIFQHHERPDGTGFPRKLSATTISPISAVFIVAHDIVQTYFKQTGTIDDVIANYKMNFKAGNFKRVVEVLLELKAEWAE